MESEKIFEAVMSIKEDVSRLDRKVSNIQEMLAKNTETLNQHTELHNSHSEKFEEIETSMEVFIQESHKNKRDILRLKEQA